MKCLLIISLLPKPELKLSPVVISKYEPQGNVLKVQQFCGPVEADKQTLEREMQVNYIFQKWFL